MTDKQLEENEKQAVTFKHPITGETFCEIAATHLALGVKRNPRDILRVKRIASRFPGLSEALRVHFPDDEDFIWADEPAQMNVRSSTVYMSAVGRAALHEGGPRVCNALRVAEGRAGRSAPIGDENVNEAEVHLREERIDALASLIALFSLPDRFAASPVQTEDEEEAREIIREFQRFSEASATARAHANVSVV